MARAVVITRAYRLGVAARVLAASVGGYAAVSALAIALARLLPLARAEATVTATLVAVLAFPALAISAFAVRSAARAWLVIGGIALAAGLIGWAIGAPR